MNRIDLQAPTLVGPHWLNLGAGTPSCTTPVTHFHIKLYLFLPFVLWKIPVSQSLYQFIIDIVLLRKNYELINDQ